MEMILVQKDSRGFVVATVRLRDHLDDYQFQ